MVINNIGVGVLFYDRGRPHMVKVNNMGIDALVVHA